MRDGKAGMTKWTDTEGSEWEFIYYILTFENKTEPNTYGIKVERRSDKPAVEMSEETGGLTFSYEEAESWVRIMEANAVGPISLHEIVDELVG